MVTSLDYSKFGYNGTMAAHDGRQSRKPGHSSTGTSLERRAVAASTPFCFMQICPQSMLSVGKRFFHASLRTTRFPFNYIHGDIPVEWDRVFILTRVFVGQLD